MRSSSSGRVGVQSPRFGLLQLVDHGGWQRVSTVGAADGTRGRRRVHVVLPPQDSTLSSAGAIHSLGSGPVGKLGFVFGQPVEVDVVVGERSFGGLEISLLGEVELHVDGHLSTQEYTGYLNINMSISSFHYIMETCKIVLIAS